MYNDAVVLYGIVPQTAHLEVPYCTLAASNFESFPTIDSALPSVTPSPASSMETPNVQGGRRASLKKLPDWARRRWGVKKRDTTFGDEWKKEMLAEERKQKAKDMIDRLRGKKVHADGEEVDSDDQGLVDSELGFLAQCYD